MPQMSEFGVWVGRVCCRLTPLLIPPLSRERGLGGESGELSLNRNSIED
jgi:hypothetical protein